MPTLTSYCVCSNSFLLHSFFLFLFLSLYHFPTGTCTCSSFVETITIDLNLYTMCRWSQFQDFSEIWPAGEKLQPFEISARRLICERRWATSLHALWWQVCVSDMGVTLTHCSGAVGQRPTFASLQCVAVYNARTVSCRKRPYNIIVSLI